MSNHKARVARLEATRRVPAISEDELMRRLDNWIEVFTTAGTDGRTGFECVKANAERWPTADNLRLARMADLVRLALARKAEHEQP